MNFTNLTILFVVLALTSCKSTKEISYFQDIEDYQKATPTEVVYYNAKICPDDQLAISVSSIDPNAVAVFNVGGTYLVDSQGYINYPVLGKLEVAGKTRPELIAELEKEISKYVKSPIVTVNITNFKISVLGEINRPGTIVIGSERVSILDAISLAGDLTIQGQRDNILLIRDNNGVKEYARFNLNSSDILSSPYYYLQQNDIVYVEPNKARKGNSKYSQNAQYNVSLISTIISAVSVIASLTIALLVK